jgi:hypothetical protein
MRRPKRPNLNPSMAILGGSLVLAAGAGAALAAGTSGAFGASTPTRTVTVNVGAGTQGPPGPAGPAGPRGPKGPPGDFSCADGYEPGVLVIDHPGGHVKVYTCLDKP